MLKEITYFGVCYWYDPYAKVHEVSVYGLGRTYDFDGELRGEDELIVELWRNGKPSHFYQTSFSPWVGPIINEDGSWESQHFCSLELAFQFAGKLFPFYEWKEQKLLSPAK